MLPSLFLSASLALADCPLLQVVPEGTSVEAAVAQLADPDGTTVKAWLARGSLVWRLPVGGCGDKWAVQVLSTDPLYHDDRRGPPPEILSVACVDPNQLAPVDGLPVQSAQGPLTLAASAACLSPSGTLPYSLLDSTTPRREPLGLDRVRGTYERLFGPMPPGILRATDWGYVGLPFVETREKPTEKFTADGFLQVGPGSPPYYVHSLGDDDPDSDIWGTPELVVTILELSKAWYPRCVTKEAPALKIPAGAAATACTLQVNDLAWYNNRNPDPLGHNSHAAGKCVDIRPFRYDGVWAESNWRRKGMAYSRGLTQAFLTYTLSEFPVTNVFFNDRTIRRRLKAVRKVHGHDDHIHLCVR